MVIGCDGAEIVISGDIEVDRVNLASLVMVLDVAICLWFIMNTSMLNAFIEREGRYRQDKFVTMPDFAIKIKNLPPQEDYVDLNQLRAQLTLHINRVVAH